MTFVDWLIVTIALAALMLSIGGCLSLVLEPDAPEPVDLDAAQEMPAVEVEDTQPMTGKWN